MRCLYGYFRQNQGIAKENRIVTEQICRKIWDSREDASAVGAGNQCASGVFGQDDGVYYGVGEGGGEGRLVMCKICTLQLNK